MADRSIKVTLRANVADFTAQMKNASSSLEAVVKAADKTGTVATTRMGRLAQSAQLQRGEWEKAGSALTKFGLVTTGALAGSIKAAVDWESAFAGVRKTVDGTPADLARIESGLRAMTGQVSASHGEIAAVAEAAGQLGVSKENIVGFTKTMVDLGEATNLSAQDAAMTLTRFMNIMGTSQDKVSNLGSSIVHLGNNYATTESEIAAMGMRLAGAGHQIGLSEGQTLGLAAALSSVGVEAEAGGSAFSRVITTMRNAVDTGGPQLETFARVAGMTGKQFQQAFKRDAGSAIGAFIKGLNGIEAAGGSMQPVLEQLGLTDLRVGDALRRAASASDVFSKAMRDGQSAFDENKALAEEVARRYETVGARSKMAWNQIKDAAISTGDSLLPVVGNLADGVAGVAKGFASLPKPVQTAAATLTGVVGVSALLTGGFLKLTPAVLETITALESLGVVSAGAKAKAGGLISAVSKIGAVVAVAGAALTALKAAQQWLEDPPSKGIKQYTNAILEIKKASDVPKLLKDTGENFLGIKIGAAAGAKSVKQYSKMVSEASRLTGSWSETYERLVAKAPGVSLDPALKVADELKEYGKALAGLPLNKAQAQFRLMTDAAGGTSKAIRDHLKLMPEYAQALRDKAQAAGLSLSQDQLAKLAVGELTLETDKNGQAQLKAADAANAAGEALSRWGGHALTAGDAGEQLRQKLQGASESFINVGEAAQSGSGGFEDFASKLEEQIESMKTWQASMAVLKQKLSPEAFSQLLDMGATGAQIAKDLTDGVNDEAQWAQFNNLMGAKGKQSSQVFAEAMDDSSFTAAVQQVMAQKGELAAVAFSDAVINKGMTLQQAAQALDVKLDVDATTDKAKAKADEAANYTTAKKPQMTLEMLTDPARIAAGETAQMAEGLSPAMKLGADPSGAIGVFNSTQADGSSRNPIMLLGAMAGPALGVINATEADGSSRRPVMTLDANGRPAIGSMNSAKGYGDRLSSWISVNATDHFTGPVWGILSSIPSVKTITVVANVVRSVAGMLGFASGGPVWGLGTGTSDSIPARLSNNEHVITAAEVTAAGGHGAIFALRHMMHTGQIRDLLRERGFAEGGTPALPYAPRPLITSGGAMASRVAHEVSVSLAGQSLALVLDDGTRFNAHIEEAVDRRIIASSAM